MAKAFFRWLRGELNGFYVTNINGALNESTKDIKDFLSEFKAQQFENGKISDKNLYGLGKFAGIFLPRLSRAESLASLRMTESFVVDGFECSERGLFNTGLENFSFFHTRDDTTVYFADPHSPWQRGLNENTNDIIRFFFPKGCDFHKVSEEDLQTVVSLINNRPRKTLDYLSPLEFISAKCCT